MESQTSEKPQSCKFYLTTKHRCCRYPQFDSDGLCVIHSKTFVRKDDRIPCPVDPSHTVYVQKLKKHLTGCSKTRDSAWELLQPFLSESSNDPLGNCDEDAGNGHSSLSAEANYDTPTDFAFSDYVEWKRLPKTPLPSQGRITRSPTLQLTAFHNKINSIYEKCCSVILKVDPKYYTVNGERQLNLKARHAESHLPRVVDCPNDDHSETPFVNPQYFTQIDSPSPFEFSWTASELFRTTIKGAVKEANLKRDQLHSSSLLLSDT